MLIGSWYRRPCGDVTDQETGAFAGAYNECSGYALIVGLMQHCFDSSRRIMGAGSMLLVRILRKTNKVRPGDSYNTFVTSVWRHKDRFWPNALAVSLFCRPCRCRAMCLAYMADPTLHEIGVKKIIKVTPSLPIVYTFAITHEKGDVIQERKNE